MNKSNTQSRLQVDFYFDFISPYSYLAVVQLAAFEAAQPVHFNWIPVNLPKLIQQSGNVPPAGSRNKGLYLLHDIKRWAAHLHVPFRMLRPGSFDSRPALRMALSLQGQARAQWCQSVFEALWSGAIDPRQDDWLSKLATQPPLAEAAALEATTAQALQAGAFGAPTFVLHRPDKKPQMFFGNDRLDFLAGACQRASD
ncbi:MAG: 2-hydroxychromene-2-carboxylate isomerase [Zetaproteobacteria bacterium CG_4_9_14_3_um_filter_49_83]|nr:MAG: 2-hydroxychromene-2-carboxylate isomerase [Zetaproteobacteria bacterium CG1_02_49_23]PIQ31779.1 MAG: 2-hydroxychromene-2-carboxylate isomerase [Zetaproteobacteria bacterium CG17_big_fil_post_rev_8_21_14_2_50_50_13]PIV31416.1 MAG: 2-hydroxychromene-2-carboxylate isomerase [Zetaproteobacteria bacterium CG02_land_8_20_14_3_00_50_9]PIY56650.1 MAG: 2-hydroxychromene-2-carboxylate isomerase [Zetaproteobacteria bacterium CG_4_10_14_0_8_um_filter_49_80]PJA34204.1 MAG: 2-hydroxychromene-2-carbox